MNKIYIIGVGADGISSLKSTTLQLVNQAEVLVGGERLLELFPDILAEKIAIKKGVAEIVRAVKDKANGKKVTVLASGDPNFFGVARYLISNLGKEHIEIIPNVSSMQLAFSRIKESWEDAVLISAHARPIDDIVDTVRRSSKIFLFTDHRNSPDAIGKLLLEEGIRGFKTFVCQDLGSAEERIFEGSLEELSKTRFSPLNVLILLKEVASGENEGKVDKRQLQRLGIPDEEFHQVKPLRQDSGQIERGLITKMEIRAVSLAKLEIREDNTVWDIGAGSGAVSIEASFLAKKGHVFAVEKEEQRLEIINKNIEKFSAVNITVINKCAPEGLESLPDPDAVFIGGSGGKLTEIVNMCYQRLKSGGRIVLNLATLDNLNTTINTLEGIGLTPEIVSLTVARSRKIRGLNRLESLNPVFTVSAKKGQIG